MRSPWLIPIFALIAWSCGPSLLLSSPTPQTSTTSQGDEAIAPRTQVELDIFSGNPNPAWTLSDADSAHFLEKLALLPAASPAEFATNLGYRGFIVRRANATESSVVRIQREGSTCYEPARIYTTAIRSGTWSVGCCAPVSSSSTQPSSASWKRNWRSSDSPYGRATARVVSRL